MMCLCGDNERVLWQYAGLRSLLKIQSNLLHNNEKPLFATSRNAFLFAINSTNANEKILMNQHFIREITCVFLIFTHRRKTAMVMLEHLSAVFQIHLNFLLQMILMLLNFLVFLDFYYPLLPNYFLPDRPKNHPNLARKHSRINLLAYSPVMLFQLHLLHKTKNQQFRN